MRPRRRPLLGLRASLTDEAWIGMSDTLDDTVWYNRFQAVSGMDPRPAKAG